MEMCWIYDAGNGVKRCKTKAERNREAQKEVNRLEKGTTVLVHFGVCRYGDEEMCEAKKFTSKV